ncbi:MAG: 2-C-methyl-D-erythritol 4-phosphate cytidylyltransferase [Bacteroidaceae bacterium]|nr:2-C-methyl-D-erythritol 4-phosphate cytidylyltransferase [Bacteroidaceae bacterium]
MKKIAILLAGGVGSRMRADRPKQFLEVNGKPILAHTIDAFECNPLIDEIAIVAHPNHVNDVENLIRKANWQKVTHVLPGGNERYDSSLAAIRAYEGQDVALLIHDAVRPLVSQRIITDVCTAINEHQAVNITIPVVDTIVQVHGGTMHAVPPRHTLQRVQTPQAFRLNVITEAYRRALADPAFAATDDCSVVFRYMPEVPIVIVPGEERNIKVTHPDDIKLIEKILENKADQ